MALRGTRITVGRLPENTIQVCDRTISAHHAELVLEGDHYRIQDLDATNGVLVNGQQVRDFHLHEACVIRLGLVECQYQPAEIEAGAADSADVLPNRREVTAIREESERLKAANMSLQKQMETMTAARAELVAGNETVVLEKSDKLAGELANMWRANHEQYEQIQRLNDTISVLRRDCDNLQKAYDDARNASQPKQVSPPPPSPRETPVATPVTTSAPLSMPPRLPKPPGQLGSSAPTMAVPTAANGVPTTPTRRPASGIIQPVRVIAAPPTPQPVSTGPKGTQRLVE